jgi:hypothetical protein
MLHPYPVLTKNNNLTKQGHELQNHQQIKHNTMPEQLTTQSVTFSTKAKVRCMLHVNDYTEKQRQAAFYGADDFRAFKKENKQTLHKMEKNQRIDENEFCVRGLERYLREASKPRNVHKRAAMSAVFAQQYMLDEDEIDDNDMPADESIALVYSSLTGPSTVSAYLMGLADAKAVQEDDIDEDDKQQQGKKSIIDESQPTACRRIVLTRMRKQNALSVRRQIVNSAA